MSLYILDLLIGIVTSRYASYVVPLCFVCLSYSLSFFLVVARCVWTQSVCRLMEVGTSLAMENTHVVTVETA